MTPPATAAATAAGRSHLRRPVRSAPPRRISGPARRPVHGSVALPPPAVTAPVGRRVLRGLATLPDARLLDRLIRGRVWIGLVAVGLIGIVFLQISLLKLNTGIGRAVETAQTLSEQNATLRADLSKLTGGERIQDSAKALGYVLPATGQPRFLDAREVSAARAAAAIAPPAPVQQLPLGMIPANQGGTAGVGTDQAAGAPVAAAVPAAATAPAAPAASVAGAAALGATPSPTLTARGVVAPKG